MLIREIRLQNLLSFGPDTPPLELRPLNVLIGPNGSGKSNLIEAMSLLQAAPKDIAAPIREGGGTAEWIWKGGNAQTAQITARSILGNGAFNADCSHTFAMGSTFGGAFVLVGEELMEIDNATDKPTVVYTSNVTEGTIFIDGKSQKINLESPEGPGSILASLRGPEYHRSITHLGRDYARIRIYRDWDLGRKSPVRLPQRTDAKNDFLAEDLSNLGLMVSKLRQNPQTKARMLELLTELYPGVRDVDILVEGNSVQIFWEENGFTVPGVRLSDGSLRFLALLIILCHPSPPPLICIEEPELGLHPDMMPTIADMLREASTRTQLIVTTHSDILVDALSDTPEDVVVCEKEDGCTTMNRLDKDKLAVWLEKYGLGHLWRSGGLGGNRW